MRVAVLGFSTFCFIVLANLNDCGWWRWSLGLPFWQFFLINPVTAYCVVWLAWLWWALHTRALQ